DGCEIEELRTSFFQEVGEAATGSKEFIEAAPGTEEIRTSFFQAVGEAATGSKEFIEAALRVIETRCEEMAWRGPKRNDSDWFDEYLGEDLLLNIIPREVSGRAVLLTMLSLVGLCGLI